MRILSIITVYACLDNVLSNYFHFEEIVYQSDIAKLRDLLNQINLFYKLNLNHFSELEKCTSKIKELESSELNWAPNHFYQVVLSAKNQLVSYFREEIEKNYKTIDQLQSKITALEKLATNEENKEPNSINHNEKLELDCSSLRGDGMIQIEINHDSDKSQMLSVYCENKWIVIQQRQNGFQQSFNKSWNEYANGFGNLKTDFWLGLEYIHLLTKNQDTELIIELTDWSDQIFTAQYGNFKLGNEQDLYRLYLSPRLNGNASKNYLDDSYYGFSSQNGAYFSTYDKINYKMKYPTKNCPVRSGGGWWFTDYSNCLPVNLNGIYVSGASAPSAKGIKWQGIRPFDRNYALKKSKMKIRPKYA